MIKPSSLSRLIVALALLPSFLGGATEPWAQGGILVLLGLLFLIAPPRGSESRALTVALLVLFAWALTTFLPARWFYFPAWRTGAIENFSLSLSPCVSPQPWITAESIVLFAAGVAWFYYLCCHLITLDRRIAVQWLCAGLVILAVASVSLSLAGMKWPFAHSDAMFGPFPNRNQTAILLAVGAILSLACMTESFRRGTWSWLLWLSGCAVLMWGLVLVASRAGIILCFAGVAIWIFCLGIVRRSRPWAIAGVGVLLIMLGAFLMGGGKALDRFLPSSPGPEKHSVNFRWAIQQDAMSLAKSAPWTGIGLGNFRSEFAVSPHPALGAADLDVLHPESDWIWLGVEMGWPGLLLTVGICGFLCGRIFPMRSDPDWRLRAAAGTAALIFGLNGLVDVPAHRLGSAFPGLFAFVLALLPRRKNESPLWLPVGFRFAGVCFCLVGATWLVAGLLETVIPGRIGVQCANRQTALLNEQGRFEASRQLATKAITWAPLDWQLYYLRAVSNALGSGNTEAALADFRRARFLNPNSPRLLFNEGLIWLHTQPVLALPAWQDALALATDSSRAQLYEQMLATPDLPPPVRAGILATASADANLEFISLGRADRPEFHERLQQLLSSEPNLDIFSDAQKKIIFRLWAQRSSPEEFLTAMDGHKAWMPLCWPYAAQAEASLGAYQRAYELAQSHLQQPVLPVISFREPVDKLRSALYANPQNFAKGYALYDTQIQSGDSEGAFLTLEKLTNQKQCPGYFHYLKAKLLAGSGKWQEAWEALETAGLSNP